MTKRLPAREQAKRHEMATAAVEAFNARYGVGQVVDYQSHPEAPPKTTRTRSQAFVLSGHTACVMLEKVSGCVALDACRPVEATAAVGGTCLPTAAEGARARRREGYRKCLQSIAADLVAARAKLDPVYAALDGRSLVDFEFELRRMSDDLAAIAAKARVLCEQAHYGQVPQATKEGA